MRQDLRKFRPMGITDILDETVDLYKSNFALFVGIAAVAYVPYSLLQTLISALQRMPGGYKPDVLDVILSVLPGLFLGLIFLSIVEPVVTGALTFAISDRYLGRPTSAIECIKRMLNARVFFSFLCVMLTKTILVALPLIVLGVVAAIGAVVIMHASGDNTVLKLAGTGLISIGFIVAGIATYILSLRLSLVEPAFLIESGGVKRSIKRTWSMMDGNVGKAFVLILVVGILVVVVTGILTSPTSIAMATSAKANGGYGVSPGIWVVHAILGAVSQTLLMPIMSIVLILLYYDIRIRKEGFDLELLAQEMDKRAQLSGFANSTLLPEEHVPTQYQSPQEPPSDENPQ